MQFAIKGYKGYKYVDYYDKERNIRFTNADYFIFDVTCDEFKNIMKSTGGFTAEMTTRMIKNKNLDCKSIMLVCTPRENSAYSFYFVYLDENKNILHKELDNNPFDFAYFKKKFKDCIVEGGYSFDLKIDDRFDEITNEFKTPSDNFNIEVDGRTMTMEDTLICDDLYLFIKEEYAYEMEKEYGVTHMELQLCFNEFNSFHISAKFVREDGSYMPKYQSILGCKTLEEFEEDYGQDNKEFYLEPYSAAISIPLVQEWSHRLQYKEELDKSELDL